MIHKLRKKTVRAKVTSGQRGKIGAEEKGVL
jgi:hypothetical protein